MTRGQRVRLALMAAVAIPAFIRYIRRAHTAEAEDKLSETFRSSTAYFVEEHRPRNVKGVALAPQFPRSQAATPGDCTKCAAAADGRCDPSEYGAAAWDTPVWQALNFAISDPHKFVYEYESSNTGPPHGTGSVFTARAQADLDDDGTCTLFERTAIVTAEGDVQGARGIYRQQPTE